jgi:hypothetical protein
MIAIVPTTVTSAITWMHSIVGKAQLDSAM